MAETTKGTAVGIDQEFLLRSPSRFPRADSTPVPRRETGGGEAPGLFLALQERQQNWSGSNNSSLSPAIVYHVQLAAY